MYSLDMSGYYYPRQSHFHKRAVGQTVKPTLVDAYNLGYTKYVNEKILPTGIDYPTFPKYVGGRIKALTGSFPAPQDVNAGQEQQAQGQSQYSSGIAGINPLLIAGLAVMAGIVVISIIKKKRLEQYSAPEFDSSDFEEMDVEYSTDADKNSVNVDKTTQPTQSTSTERPNGLLSFYGSDSTIDYYGATDPVVRDAIIADLIGGEMDMKKLMSKHGVGKGVVYNIRYNLQTQGKLEYIKKQRKGGIRRGGITSTPSALSPPPTSEPVKRALPPPPSDFKIHPLPPPPEDWMDPTPLTAIIPSKPKSKSKKTRVKPASKVKLPKLEEPTDDKVKASVGGGENYMSLLSHYGKDVDLVIMNLLQSGDVIETSPGNFKRGV